jgi:hypothetical protein
MQQSSKYTRRHDAVVAQHAAHMRSALTPSEAALWAHLRQRTRSESDLAETVKRSERSNRRIWGTASSPPARERLRGVGDV